MNVQQTIIKGIREQLFVHQYLVLPDFGGFVLKSSSAHFSGTGVLVPPSKTIGFNAQLKQNDGNLAAWLCAKMHISPEEATNHLKEFAEFCKTVIHAKRRLTLDSIGFFYLDFENNLCFEPQQDANFLTASFGLSPVSVKELSDEKTEPAKQTVFEDRKLAAETAQVRANKPGFNLRRAIVPVAFIFILFSLLALFVSNTIISGQLRASVLNANTGTYQPLAYPELNIAQVAVENTAYVADANGIAPLELGSEIKLAVEAVHVSHAAIATKHTGSTIRKAGVKNNFEIVLGCFGVLDNAKRMAEQLSLQNIEANISSKNEKGLYTVSNGSFASKNEAIAKLTQVKARFPKAWIKSL